MTDRPAFVLLEDGAWFPGTTARPIDPAFGEVVFTTNLTGYQETFTDPSYLGQIVVMTAPMIGNYGVNIEDMESARPQISGVVVRELSRHPSNWRATRSLDDWLAEAGVPVLEGIDTRRLTRHLRERGAMRGVVAEGRQPEPRSYGPAARLAVDGRTRSGVAGDRARAVDRGGGSARRGLRLRHEAEHRADAGARGLPGHGGAGRDVGGRGASAKS